MVSYTEAQVFKNNNKIMQLNYHSINTRNQIKMLPLTVTFHDPNTTFHVRRSVLRGPCASLWAIYQRCNILSPHNPVTI